MASGAGAAGAEGNPAGLPCRGASRWREEGRGAEVTALSSPLHPSPRSFRLDCDPESGVARIALNRPERMNALTFAVYDELRRTMRALHGEPAVRAIVIAGAGPDFCVGNDEEEIAALGERKLEGLLEFTRMACDLTLAIRSCCQPVIAALGGQVAGAGAVIATACDLRIGAESARISYSLVPAGLSGAEMGAAWLLPRIVGLGRASELLMTGEWIDAVEAHRIGLLNRLAPDGEEEKAALALAAEMARGPAFALRMTKEALNAEAHLELAEALEAEARAQAVCMLNPDFRGGERKER